MYVGHSQDTKVIPLEPRASVCCRRCHRHVAGYITVATYRHTHTRAAFNKNLSYQKKRFICILSPVAVARLKTTSTERSWGPKTNCDDKTHVPAEKFGGSKWSTLMVRLTSHIESPNQRAIRLPKFLVDLLRVVLKHYYPTLRSRYFIFFNQVRYDADIAPQKRYTYFKRDIAKGLKETATSLSVFYRKLYLQTSTQL